MNPVSLDPDATYDAALAGFDAAVCEALAVGQGSADRLPQRHISWGSRIFARLCGHATAMVRAAPRSRWVRSDSEDWHFSSVAPHARAILEGVPFFLYFVEQPSSDDEVSARVNMLHLNDCTRRINLFTQLGSERQKQDFEIQQEQLRERLRRNTYFAAMPEKAQRECLKGEKPWLKTRSQLNEMAGIDEVSFETLWLLYSQHSHILPLSFHRFEQEGRGSGLQNETDQHYIQLALSSSSEYLGKATTVMTFHFPDTADLRKGVQSKFRPGPRENAYALREGLSIDDSPAHLERSILSRNLQSFLNVIRRRAQ